jgi:hypothetical protein
MKYLAQITDQNSVVIRTVPDDFSLAGWYPIEREPDFMGGEYLELVGDTIIIKKREKTPDEVAAEEKMKKDAESFTPAALADLVKRVEALEKKV